MPAYSGRDVLLEFAIGDENSSPSSLTFLTLGMMRGKGMSVTWDTADATADKSPAFTKQTITTFKMVEFSGDGVAYTEALHNQSTLKAHVYNPGVGTGSQPKVWLRQTAPDGVTIGPFTVTEWDSDAPYADVVTWSMTAMSNGQVTFTPT
jgi:predicted secreted protein